MNDFPLQPFLGSLAADGIRLTLRDYERIHLALRTGGPWSVARLRNTLVALLARDVEQEDVIRQRFDEQFWPELEAEDSVAELNMAHVLAELKRMTTPRAEEPQLAPVPQRLQKIFTFPEPAKQTRRLSRFWAVWSTLLAAEILPLQFHCGMPQRRVPIQPRPVSNNLRYSLH